MENRKKAAKEVKIELVLTADQEDAMEKDEADQKATDERAEEAAVNGSEAERDKVTPDCEEPMLASSLEAKSAKKRKVSKSKSKGKKKKKSTSTANKKTVDIETRIVSSYAENPALEFMKILETAYLNSKKAGPDLEQKINAARKRHI